METVSRSMANRRLVPMPTRRAPRQSPQFEEPVFVEHEPVISHQHRNETRRDALLI